MQSNLEIGERIRGLRENLHMSREKFSEMINISEVFLGQIERGERSLSLKTLSNIVSYTGSSSDYILFGNQKESTVIEKVNRILENNDNITNEYVYEMIRNLHHFSQNMSNEN